MSSHHITADEQIRIAKAYFAKVDAGDGTLLGMFTEDVQAWFPKIGMTHGKAELATLVQTLTSVVRRFVHDPSQMLFTHEQNRLVVEGLESGEFADGRPFPAGAKSSGRFCNVFEFRDGLICRLHIYADPDYAGQCDSLFPTPATRSDDQATPAITIAHDHLATGSNVATTARGEGTWHANSKGRSPSSPAGPRASGSPPRSASPRKEHGCT